VFAIAPTRNREPLLPAFATTIGANDPFVLIPRKCWPSIALGFASKCRQ